jgi:hypothetical protein
LRLRRDSPYEKRENGKGKEFGKETSQLCGDILPPKEVFFIPRGYRYKNSGREPFLNILYDPFRKNFQNSYLTVEFDLVDPIPERGPVRA